MGTKHVNDTRAVVFRVPRAVMTAQNPIKVTALVVKGISVIRIPRNTLGLRKAIAANCRSTTTLEWVVVFCAIVKACQV